MEPAQPVTQDESPSTDSLQTGAATAIGTAAVVIMAGNLTSSLLGFARQAVITKVFGDTAGTDAFFAASIVPQIFYDLTIGAAISAALIPTFSEIAVAAGLGQLRRTSGAVLALAWAILTIVIVALVFAAHPLMSLILLGFSRHSRPGALRLSVEMVRILVPTLFFLGSSAVVLSVLYSLRRFPAPAFASALYHLGVIAGALLLVRPLGYLALPVGALAGAAAQAASQIPALVRARAIPHVRLSLDPEVRRVVRLYLPVSAGLVVSVVGQLIDIRFKWSLPAGGLTAMQLATTLTQFPIGIAVAAMSFAILPSISTHAAFDRLEQFKDTLAAGIRLVLFLTIPAAAGYIALSSPIVSLLYQHGHFTAGAVSRTTLALIGYAIQIPFVGLDQLLIFSFYARKNTVTPMLVGVVGVVIYVGGALILLPRLHILGLALANTVQNSVHGLILLGLLFASLGTLSGRGILASVLKSTAAAAAMAVVAALSAELLIQNLPHTTLATQLVEVMGPLGAGFILYVGVSALLRNPELQAARAMIPRRASVVEISPGAG